MAYYAGKEEKGGYMGRIRKKWVLVRAAASLLFMAALFLTACGEKEVVDTKPAQAAKADQKADQPDSDKQKADGLEQSKSMEGIPKELLPGYEGAGGTLDASAKAAGKADMGAAALDGKTVSGQSEEENGNAGEEAGNSNTSNAASSGGTGAQKSTITIDFQVDGSSAKEYGYSVSYSSAIALNKGATVYDALLTSGLAVVGGGYITGIGGLFEKDCGSQSGWKYYVNGAEPQKACNKYSLKDGDLVQWEYVLNP